MNTLSNFQLVKNCICLQLSASVSICPHLPTRLSASAHACQYIPPLSVTVILYPYSFFLSHALMPMAYFQ